jgi:hypothetical protein
MNQPKIRPPSHSSHQPSPKEIRDEAEGDLPEQARMPDPGRADVGDAVNAADGAPAPPPGSTQWPERPPGAAFTPAEAHAFRQGHGAQNRLGNPPQLSDAEAALVDYQTKLKAFRDDYAGTRSTKLERPFLEAKQKMIDMGLMKGDV